MITVPAPKIFPKITGIMLCRANIVLELFLRIKDWLVIHFLRATISAALTMNSMEIFHLVMNILFVAYHLTRIKCNAVDFLKTISRMFILLKNIIRTKKMFMPGQHFTQTQIADLRQRKNEILDSFDHICNIGLVGVVTWNCPICCTFMFWFILGLRLLGEDAAPTDRNIDDCLRVMACMLIMEFFLLAEIDFMVATSVCTLQLVMGRDLTGRLPPPLTWI